MRQHPFIMAAIAVSLLAACGSSASGPGVASGGGKATATSSATTTASDNGLQYARCMRANGVDVADPEAGHALKVPGPQAGPQEQKALDACRQLLPNGGVAKQPSTVQLAQLREYAKCMRANGVDMPDPDTNGGVGLQSVGDPDKMAAASKTCQSKRPGRK